MSSKEANIKCPQTVKNLENKNICKSVLNQGDQVLRGPVDLAEHRRGGGREKRLAENQRNMPEDIIVPLVINILIWTCVFFLEQSLALTHL